MSDASRTSYFEAIPPTQRLPDYVPAALVSAASLPVRPAPDREPEPVPVGSPASAATMALPAAGELSPDNTSGDKQTVKRTGRISSPVHRVQRPGGLAVSFSLLLTDEEAGTAAYRVYATKQFAERLVKQDLQQGSLVEVAGQPQLREEAQADGSRTPVPYLYCFGVRVLAAPS